MYMNFIQTLTLILSFSFVLPIQASDSQNQAEGQYNKHTKSSQIKDEKEGEDKCPLNFLAQKYPKLLKKSEESFKLTKSEKEILDQGNNMGGIIGWALGKCIKFDKLIHLGSFKSTLASMPYDKEALEAHLLGSPKQAKSFVEMQLKTLQNKHPRNGFYNHFFNSFSEPEHICESLILSAEYLYQIIQGSEKGCVLFLGRSPCLLQVAYDQICAYFLENKIATENSHPSVHLSFSRSPDRDAKREGELKQDSDIRRIRNIVTQEKLDHYFKYIDEQNIIGFKKIYIVDIVGSGVGLNSFLDVLNLYFKSHQKEMPMLELMHVSDVMIQDFCKVHKEKVFVSFKADLNTFNKGIISFKKDLECNIKPISIHTRTILTSFLALKCLLDNDLFQAYCVHGIEYPAQKWTHEYDEERKNGGEFHKEVYEYFQRQVKNIVNFHYTKYYKK